MNECIVIDNGSGVIKAGFSGEDTPRCTFPSIVGSVEDSELNRVGTTKANHRDPYVGNHAQQQRDLASMTYPIERGKIMDWDKMEIIWEYIMDHELQCNSESNMPVLLTDYPLTPMNIREKMAQIMFEELKFPAFYVMQQCVLSLYASARTRGIVVEAGFGACHSVPIFEGYALPHATLRCDVGGQDITQHLKRSLSKAGHVLPGHESYVIQDIKEKHCSLHVHPTTSTTSTSHLPLSKSSYELPDGSIIEIQPEWKTNAPEIIFNTSLLGDKHPSSKEPGLLHIVKKSISMCDKDLQRDLYGMVVLAGGTSMISGFAQRIYNELDAERSNHPLRVVPRFHGREKGYNSHRKIAAWIGGSIFASLSTFHQIQITRQEWEEHHETILHSKCF